MTVKEILVPLQGLTLTEFCVCRNLLSHLRSSLLWSTANTDVYSDSWHSSRRGDNTLRILFSKAGKTARFRRVFIHSESFKKWFGHMKQKTHLLSRMVNSFKNMCISNTVNLLFFLNVCFISDFFIVLSIPSLSLQTIILSSLTCSNAPSSRNGALPGYPSRWARVRVWRPSPHASSPSVRVTASSVEFPTPVRLDWITYAHM